MNEIIELINQTLEFNNIKSFKDFFINKEIILNNNKIFNIKDKQWLNKNNRKESDVMLYQLIEKFYILLHDYQEEGKIPKYLNCNRPFDIYFTYGNKNNFYIVQFSENDLYLIAMNTEVIFPTLESEFIQLHVEKIN